MVERQWQTLNGSLPFWFRRQTVSSIQFAHCTVTSPGKTPKIACIPFDNVTDFDGPHCASMRSCPTPNVTTVVLDQLGLIGVAAHVQAGPEVGPAYCTECREIG